MADPFASWLGKPDPKKLSADPFSTYGSSATSHTAHRPAKLLGPIKTRKEAMARYAEIVAELKACEDAMTLEAYLASIDHEIAQYKAELPFLWEGDSDDFPGLEGEISLARDEIAVREGEWKFYEN